MIGFIAAARRDRRWSSLLCVAIVVCLAGSVRAGSPEDAVSQAKAWYGAAAYEQALALLKTESTAEALQYRALCLRALGRSDEAVRTIELLVRSWPTFTVAADDASPGFVTMFNDARRRVLPAVTRERFKQAQERLASGAYESAASTFQLVVQLASGPAWQQPAEQADLQFLGRELLELTRARAAAAAAANVAIAPPPDRVDADRVKAILAAYASAFGRLDASAARAVWPSADERALKRAFAGLASQTVSLDRCDIAMHDATASATCLGRASYVGKVGSGERRSERRTWHFAFKRDDGEWRIETVDVRRITDPRTKPPRS